MAEKTRLTRASRTNPKRTRRLVSGRPSVGGSQKAASAAATSSAEAGECASSADGKTRIPLQSWRGAVTKNSSALADGVDAAIALKL
jgi:hypothetical protein